MSPEGQEPIEQAGAGDPAPEIPGLVLLLYLTVMSAITAGYVFFSNFLNRLLGLTEDFSIYLVGIAAVAMISALAVPRTIRHVGMLAAVAAAAGILGMVVSAPFLLIAQSIFAQDADHALQWTIIFPGLFSSMGAIYLVCTWGIRRLAVPQRQSRRGTSPRRVK